MRSRFGTLKLSFEKEKLDGHIIADGIHILCFTGLTKAGQDYLFQGQAKIHEVVRELQERAFLNVPAEVKTTTLF